MSNWRERLAGRITHQEIQDYSDESMAITRILKALGMRRDKIGQFLRQLGFEYVEEDTTFIRLVKIMRATLPKLDPINVIDVKSGKKFGDIVEDLLCDPRPGIIFFRIVGEQQMTAFIRAVGLCESPLAFVLKPGIRYVAERNGIQLWEQDPVTLIKSFQTER